MANINEKIRKANNLPVEQKLPDNMQNKKTPEIKEILEKYRGQISQALPRHLTADRIIQLSTNLIAKNPEIATCTPESIIGWINFNTNIVRFKHFHKLPV